MDDNFNNLPEPEDNEYQTPEQDNLNDENPSPIDNSQYGYQPAVYPEGPYTQFIPPEILYKKQQQKEKKAIRLIGSVAGICVISYIFLENILSIPIYTSRFLNNLYYTNSVFHYTFSMILSILGLLGPFIVGGYFLKKRTKIPFLKFNAPKDKVLAALAVPMGVFICIFGNYVTGIFLAGMKRIGFELTSPDTTIPSSIPGRILFAISVAVIPPIIEEIAIRGAIMQPLRRYGDRFAIIVTSALFGILHGNLVQAPFAFFAGLGLGYVCCITNSLIPSMIIHFINNLFSVIVDFLIEDIKDDHLLNVIYNTAELSMVVIGAICGAIFVFRLNHKKLYNPPTLINNGQKGVAFFLNAPMIVALLMMMYFTSFYISYNPVI